MDGFEGYDDLRARLGPHSVGKSCLYVKRLPDLDPDVLAQLSACSVARVRRSSSPEDA